MRSTNEEARSSHCMSLRIITNGGVAAALLLSLLLPDNASSFVSPAQSKLRRIVHARRGNDLFYRVPLSPSPLDRNVNGTSQHITAIRASSTSTLAQDEDTALLSNVLEPNSDTTLFEHELLSNVLEPNATLSLFEQKLLERFIEHQSLLNSPTTPTNNEHQLVTSTSSSIAILPEQELSPSSEPSGISNILNLSDVWKARLLLLLSAALYGTNFTFVKSLDERMSVGLSSTLRFGFAALIMLPWLFAPMEEYESKSLMSSSSSLSESSERNDADGSIDGNFDSFFRKLLAGGDPTKLSATLAGMEIGLYNSIGYIAQAVGLKTTTASKSAFICSLAVVTVPILDKLWGKPLLRRQIIGACLAAFGVYALELGGSSDALTEGDLLSLVQPVMFGLGFWRMEAAVENFPKEAARLAAANILMVFLMSASYLIYSSSSATTMGMDAGGVLLSDACNSLPTTSEIMTWLQTPSILGMLVWTGVVTTAFTMYMETVALKTLSAAETTLIFSTEPLFGAAFAALVANECLGPEAAVGAAFIIGGCLVSGMDVGSLLKGKDTRMEDDAVETSGVDQ
mmetsp:Transcript_4689/g.10328  ORF Transcript_4689/g.10328 Transcript_4689/m.10328 type:complete len:570 (-) Transcript_4689:37-1746(-)